MFGIDPGGLVGMQSNRSDHLRPVVRYPHGLPGTGDVDPDLNHSIHAHGLAGRECGVHRQAPLAVASGSTDVQVAMTVDHRAG